MLFKKQGAQHSFSSSIYYLMKGHDRTHPSAGHLCYVSDYQGYVFFNFEISRIGCYDDRKENRLQAHIFHLTWLLTALLDFSHASQTGSEMIFYQRCTYLRMYGLGRSGRVHWNIINIWLRHVFKNISYRRDLGKSWDRAVLWHLDDRSEKKIKKKIYRRFLCSTTLDQKVKPGLQRVTKDQRPARPSMHYCSCHSTFAMHFIDAIVPNCQTVLPIARA